MLLHQPTLLNSFGGTIQHLYPNSRDLSMSSAKTIADILSFSELVDGKSFIGNPFTSQPMYIAACAFLMESAHYSSPSSRSVSPSHQPLLANQTSGFFLPSVDSSSNPSDRKPAARYSLLASAARENYQRCYKALKALENYWEGTKYILTVLNQKAKGIVDPLLYTEEEMEGTTGTPSAQPVTGSNWRQSHLPGSTNATGAPISSAYSPDGRGSPRMDPSQGKIISLYLCAFAFMIELTLMSAIGWALTNATNSSQPNLSLLYQMPAAPPEPATDNKSYPSQYSHSYTNVPVQPGIGQGSGSFARDIEPTNTSSVAHDSLVSSGQVATSDATLLLGLNSQYPHPVSRPSNSQPTRNIPSSSSTLNSQVSAYNYIPPTTDDRQASGGHMGSRPPDLHSALNAQAGGDLLIESQDVDMSALHQQDQFPFPFSGLPWLEYLPQDVLNYFSTDHQNYPLMSPDEGAPPPH